MAESKETVVRVVLAVILSLGLTQATTAHEACDAASFIHNYPVHDAGAYGTLFDTVEGYVPGPRGERAWPFAENGDKEYPTRDFCPTDPEDRLMRLFEVTAGETERAAMQAGTLTLVTKDLQAAREAAVGLASKEPRDQELQGRRSIYFSDAAGNEFIIWEYPGPPN